MSKTRAANQKTDKEMNMEENSKIRFEQIDKRFDDLKSLITYSSGTFTIIFAIVSIVFAWNLQSEKASLLQTQIELRQEVHIGLRKLEVPPKLELFGLNQKTLTNQNIVAEVVRWTNGFPRITLRWIARNTGVSGTGPLHIKYYTSDPLKLDASSSDEDKFKYETYISPENQDSKDYPGGISVERFDFLDLASTNMPPKGSYPSLVKVYFGKGKVVQAPFNIVIPGK